jgi:hypothetical protein
MNMAGWTVHWNVSLRSWGIVVVGERNPMPEQILVAGAPAQRPAFLFSAKIHDDTPQPLSQNANSPLPLNHFSTLALPFRFLCFVGMI